MKHLLLQIAAPIMSWGNEQARQDRTTDDHPRKSAILGLLGAALGKLRSDPWHAHASAAFGFASVVLRPGKRLSDYHTVLTPTKGQAYATRREEIEASDYTIETVREYLSDAYFVVTVWQRKADHDMDLDGLAVALESPIFEPYAGRKSCTLSLPMAPMIADVATLRDAFLEYRRNLFIPLLEKGELPCRIYWEDHPSSGLVGVGTRTRLDAIVDRSRSLFNGRTEHEGTVVLFEKGERDVPVKDQD